MDNLNANHLSVPIVCKLIFNRLHSTDINYLEYRLEHDEEKLAEASTSEIIG
jgi:hypothetical protein